MDKQTYFRGTGRRKTAVAQVKIVAGNGAIIVDGVPMEQRFPCLEHRRIITQPFLVTETLGKFNAIIKVEGGGVSGQSDAIAHGIARALVKADERYKPLLRQYGLLTRDARVKERKKPGLKRARKAPQYTKR
ncbi:MAG: 30S ribosomal protein S9 [Dehalococcoidales bacterium]|nr:30S ribosomal protein S9 [Dehalococcoidales bacterium]